MPTQLATLRSFETVARQVPKTIGTVKEAAAPKKRTLLRVIIIKVKLFFWNLSPLHWYEGFKEIKINMDEFMCKKSISK